MHQYYLEDNNVLLMDEKELFEYIYMYDLKKIKDAFNFIDKIVNLEITAEDSNKTIMQKILQKNNNVCKLGDKHYAYKES